MFNTFLSSTHLEVIGHFGLSLISSDALFVTTIICMMDVIAKFIIQLMFIFLYPCRMISHDIAQVLLHRAESMRYPSNEDVL